MLCSVPGSRTCCMGLFMHSIIGMGGCCRYQHGLSCSELQLTGAGETHPAYLKPALYAHSAYGDNLNLSGGSQAEQVSNFFGATMCNPPLTPSLPINIDIIFNIHLQCKLTVLLHCKTNKHQLSQYF